MCYSLFLSTTSPENLSELTLKLAVFHTPDQDEHQKLESILKHTNRWYISTIHGGCSCHFVHFMDENPFFAPIEDWRPVDPEYLEATVEVCNVIKRLLSEAYEVDVVDAWEGCLGQEYIDSFMVSLKDIPDEEFRFFENFRFEFQN